MNKYSHLAPSRTSKKKEIFRAMRGAASACLRKTAFDTEDSASTRAKQITDGGTPMRVYNCPHCLRWHLSRIKKPVIQSAAPTAETTASGVGYDSGRPVQVDRLLPMSAIEDRT